METVGAPQSEPNQQDRIVILFPELRDRRPPARFIHLDEALDRLGLQRFPQEWGRSPVWQYHPFGFEDKRNSFYSYGLVRSRGGYKIRRSSLNSLEDVTALRACDALYKRVADELASAFEVGWVETFRVVAGKEQPERVPAGSTLWSKQRLSAFYTGYLRFGDKSHGKRREIVLVGVTSFEEWLRPKEMTSDTKSLSNHACNMIIDSLLSYAKAKDICYKQDWLFELMKTALAEQSFLLSRRQFQQRIWENPLFNMCKHPKGPPRQKLEDALKSEREGVQRVLVAAYHDASRRQMKRDLQPSRPTGPLTA